MSKPHKKHVTHIWRDGVIVESRYENIVEGGEQPPSLDELPPTDEQGNPIHLSSESGKRITTNADGYERAIERNEG